MGMLSVKGRRKRLLLGLVFAFTLTILSSKALCEDAPLANQLEQEKFNLERAKFELENRKANWSYWLEIYRMILTAVAIAGPLVYGLYTLRKQARYSFELKTAEILLNSKTPGQLRAKAEVLKQLFPKAPLPKDFNTLVEEFDPEKYSGPSTEWKMELFKNLVANPDKARETIQLWKSIFPKDNWIKNLETAVGSVTTSPKPKEGTGKIP